MTKFLSKFGEQQLVMVNYACGFNQSETGKYFEWIIIMNNNILYHGFKHRPMHQYHMFLMSFFLLFNLLGKVQRVNFEKEKG